MVIYKNNTITLSVEDLNINLTNVYYQLGYKNCQPDEHTKNLTEEFYEKCKALIEPKAEFTVRKVDGINKKIGNLEVENIDFSIQKIIASQILNSEFVAFFIGTIGDKVEKLSGDLLKNGHPLEGYIVNLIGSEAAEAIAEFSHNYIGDLLKKNGLFITNRFSPGYCGWNVNEQHKLFRFFPNNYSQISINESALMHPIKSVSGIIGAGKQVSLKPYACKKCKVEDCLYRKFSNL